ncbi:MAG: NTP transferase domain-containing protein, partial [Bacillota bacterium]
TAPCDSPFLPLDLAARLHTELLASNAELAFAVTGAGQTRQPQPVFCLLQTALLPSLERYLETGGRKIGQWHASVRSTAVWFADEQAFSNINTLSELQQFEASSSQAPDAR